MSSLRELASSGAGVKVYHISGSKSVPAWERLASDRARRKLRQRDEELQRHLELVQGLTFDAACSSISATADGNYLLAAGYHPPTIKCYDLNELSLKWQRCLTSEIVRFLPLEEDYAKIAFVCADRTLAFHAKFGAYFATRTPRVGRALAYVPETAELLVGGSSSEIYRLDLSEGRFMAPLETGMDAVNALDMCPAHGLLAAGGEGAGAPGRGAAAGRVECFDPRSRGMIGALRVDDDVSAVRFSGNGMQLACGTAGGIVKVFDLRSSRPVIEKDHMYDSRIVSIDFHSAAAGALEDTRRSIVSSDRHAVRVWDAATGETAAAIEPPKTTVNDVCAFPGSGLLLVGCEHAKVQSYFIPSMGPAPRWCHFLEGLTEELEENAGAVVYDDYKFVTKQELGALGLEHLIGTKLLRASMHGFFIDLRLYKKARSIADPFAFEKYRKQKIDAALRSQEGSRIAVRKRLPKVNADLASRLREQAAGNGGAGAAPPNGDVDSEEEDDEEEEDRAGEEGDGGARRKDMTPAERKRMKRERARATEAAAILGDDRFKAMFEDERFQVDQQSAEYKILHPNAEQAAGGSLLEEHYEEEEDEDEEEDDDEGGASGDDARDGGPTAGPSAWGMDADIAFGGAPRRGERKRMLVERDEAHASAFSKGVSLRREMEMPLGERVAEERVAEGRNPRGARAKTVHEMTFEVETGKGKRKRKGGGRRTEGLHRRSVSKLVDS